MRLLPLVLVLSLIAGSCSDSDPTAAPSTTTNPATTNPTPPTITESTEPEVDIELTDSFRGVTTEEIHVGITSVDWDLLAAAGVEFGRTNSADLYVAALEEINDRGGIFGRMLVPHVEYFLPLGSTTFDAACNRLTGDDEVFVVIGQAVGDRALCFVEINDTAAVLVAGLADSLTERATAPFATLWASFETQAANLVRAAEEAGVLEGATIGVVGSVDTGEIEYQSIVDAFNNAGYDVIEGLIGGNTDDLAETARDQAVIYERLRSEGVDLTVSTTGVPLEIENAEEAGHTTDQWLLTVAMTATGLTDAGVDLEYLDGALAVVNTPVATTAQPEMANDPAVAACVDNLESRAGRDLPYELGGESNDLITGLYACGIATLLEAAMTSAGPELTNDSLQLGLESIGDIELPGYLSASLGVDDLGAAKGLQLVQFDAVSGAWEAVGGGG